MSRTFLGSKCIVCDPRCSLSWPQLSPVGKTAVQESSPKIHVHSTLGDTGQVPTRPTGVTPGGGGGEWGMYPPTFMGGGWPVQISPPPLFEDKITLNLTFIVKKLTFLTVKLLKTPKVARSHTETRSLQFCQYMYSFLDIIYVKKGVDSSHCYVCK